MCTLMAKQNGDNGYLPATLACTLFLPLFFLQPLRIQGHAVLASDNFVHNSRGSYRMLGSVQNHPKPLRPSFGRSVYFFWRMIMNSKYFI